METETDGALFTGAHVYIFATTAGLLLAALHPSAKARSWARLSMVGFIVPLLLLIPLGFGAWELGTIDLTGWNGNGPFWAICFSGVLMMQILIHGVAMIRRLDFEERFAWILVSHWACLWATLLYRGYAMESVVDMLFIMGAPFAALWILLSSGLILMLVLFMPPAVRQGGS